ncbi:MAG: hypothetical protein ABSA57_02040 [Candidatus Acidiferrales bacterium]|jgi:hypothetical protein
MKAPVLEGMRVLGPIAVAIVYISIVMPSNTWTRTNQSAPQAVCAA